MTRAIGSRVPLEDWDAQVLRLTTFHPTGTLANVRVADDWWEATTGQSPESSNLSFKAGQRADAGPVSGGTLALQIQTIGTQRVDWLLGKAERESESESPDPTPSSFAEKQGAFERLMRMWWPNCPLTTRMAFGCIVVLEVENKDDGYAKLSNYLNFDLDKGISDFLYQVNRPRSYGKIDGLRINRLAKWSVGMLAAHRIEVSLQASRSFDLPSKYFLRLELDINTADDFTLELDPNRLDELFRDLNGFGREIVAEGDVP